MARDYKDCVNQKLYFARIHIGLLQQELASKRYPQHVAEEAIGESVVFHLVGVYQAWLQELAANYFIAAEDVRSLPDLMQGFASKKLISSAEANELKVLEETDSWLHALLEVYQKTVHVVLEAREQSAAGSAIPVRQISGPEINLQNCVDWHRQLSLLIERSRETMYEY